MLGFFNSFGDLLFFFFFQAEDGIRNATVTGVQTCALPIYWPKRLGEAPKNMISGVPEHVDGRMIGITEAAGARLINRDRMWHYVEGIENWSPIWPRHGIRILPGPSSMWFDATGTRLPSPLFP